MYFAVLTSADNLLNRLYKLSTMPVHIHCVKDHQLCSPLLLFLQYRALSFLFVQKMLDGKQTECFIIVARSASVNEILDKIKLILISSKTNQQPMQGSSCCYHIDILLLKIKLRE